MQLTPDLLNPASNIPLYKQVLTILKNQIADGTLKVGDRVPSEIVLMHELGVSRITVRNALSELVEDGILIRSQGKGTFVAKPAIAQSANDTIGFNRSCIISGKTPSTRLLSLEWVLPTQHQAEHFGITDQTKIICSKRLRFVDGIPTMIEINHYPAALNFLFSEDLNGSLFAILRKHNYEFLVQRRSLKTVYASTSDAQLLEIKPGMPLLLFKDVHLDSSHNPSFISRQLYNTENMEFYF